MHEWVKTLSSGLPELLVGRKAAALGRLVAAGFPVPPGVCITTGAFHAAASSASGLQRLPPGLLDELARVLPVGLPLAVRSSALDEDGPDTSRAGRYTTCLNVQGLVALEQAVLDCWRSYLPKDPDQGGMAVLIQPLLDAECAGVCFTLDPVRQRPDLLLVSAAWGLGLGVVSGSIPTDTFRLRRIDLEVEDFSIADKHSALRPSPAGGIQPAAVPAGQRRVSALPDSWLERIGQFGLAIEQLFGTPQDVEWAVSGGQLWILQSRAVTALADSLREAPRFPLDWHDDEEARHFWWVERAEPLLPAQLDFMCINTRGGHDAVYNRGGSDTRWRKAVNGRVYMAKAKSPNSPGHVRVYTAAARDLYERLAQQGITWWEYWGPEIVRATDRLAAFKPEQADGLCLAEHLEDALAAAVRHWMIHTIVPGRPIRSARLLELYARILGRPAGDLAAEIPFLLAGSETIQTKLVESLFELANLALADPHSAKMIVLGSAGDVQAEIPALTLFAAGFDQLMRAYGGRLCFRQVAGSPAELPSAWREAPEYVWSLIAAYIPLARQGGPGPRETRLKQLSAMDARIEALCSDALKRGLDQTVIEDFRQSLAYARRNAVYLDEHNHYIDQLSEGQFVQSLIYAGRWLAERACLPNPTDVFWLTSDEVLAALRDCPPGLDAFLTQRRAQFSEWQPLLPPACLGLPDAKLPDRPGLALRQAQAAADPLDLPANSLMGEPASRGRVSGRARLMAGAYPPLDILPGDVLVAAFAGPTMIPILPAVAALALDYGGPGDHFAITAREFGLTSVCALRYATQKIPEGAWVTVDGDTGLVTWNSPGSLG